MRNKLGRRATLLAVAMLASFSPMLPVCADQVDEVILAEMKQHNISGLSLAIINDGAVIRQKGYGYTDLDRKTRVTHFTPFQAASVSKPVAALGALHLVDKGLLALDADVNTELRTWSVRPNTFTQERKVTLRSILCRRAGFTNHRYVGYAVDRPAPTLLQVLNGEKTANTSAVRVNRIPGSQWAYSGDGYLVMQQMMSDVTKESFPRYMDRIVLRPLGMNSSTFAQPLPEDSGERIWTFFWNGG